MGSALKRDDFIVLALTEDIENRKTQYVHMADTQRCQDLERMSDI